MAEEKDYLALLTMLIQKHMVVLGPKIALEKAREVSGLNLDEKGNTVSITGSGNLILQDLVEGYFELSGEVSRYFAKKFLAKFPDIKLKF